MDEQSYIFHFAFTPTKLSEVRKKVEEKYRDIDMLTASQISYLRLPKILEMIRNTAEDRLEQLASEFNRRDFSVLTYSYPYSKESGQVQKKINMVLASGYTPGNANMIWEKFQREYKHIYTEDLLRRFLLKDEDISFIYSDYSEADLKVMLLPAFMHKSGIAQGLLQVMIDKDPNISEFLKKIKIKPETPLEDYLVYERLKEGLGSKGFIEKNKIVYITQMLEKYSIEQYQGLLKKYLENRTFEEFDLQVMNQALKRLHDPRERDEDWIFLLEQTRQEVNKWLVQAVLEDYFDTERFKYWKNYLRVMVDVKTLKRANDPKVIFLYFENFVVVEFGENGKAVYFYYKEGFDRFILPRTNSHEFLRKGTSDRESMLKVRDIELMGEPLFINKLHHIPKNRWMDRFTRYMKRYFDGDYSYTERK
ncbi:EH signature domain-containing protein [Paenibacillus sp. GYB006]|uniref:EH signature domain-containing protein n=1 Tax=Paenibacillus sp. GYB006 TaxID=2994394 RepID=UPI002F963750